MITSDGDAKTRKRSIFFISLLLDNSIIICNSFSSVIKIPLDINASHPNICAWHPPASRNRFPNWRCLLCFPPRQPSTTLLQQSCFGLQLRLQLGDSSAGALDEILELFDKFCNGSFSCDLLKPSWVLSWWHRPLVHPDRRTRPKLSGVVPPWRLPRPGWCLGWDGQADWPPLRAVTLPEFVPSGILFRSQDHNAGSRLLTLSCVPCDLCRLLPRWFSCSIFVGIFFARSHPSVWQELHHTPPLADHDNPSDGGAKKTQQTQSPSANAHAQCTVWTKMAWAKMALEPKWLLACQCTWVVDSNVLLSMICPSSAFCSELCCNAGHVCWFPFCCFDHRRLHDFGSPAGQKELLLLEWQIVEWLLHLCQYVSHTCCWIVLYCSTSQLLGASPSAVSQRSWSRLSALTSVSFVSIVARRVSIERLIGAGPPIRHHDEDDVLRSNTLRIVTVMIRPTEFTMKIKTGTECPVNPPTAREHSVFSRSRSIKHGYYYFCDSKHKWERLVRTIHHVFLHVSSSVSAHSNYVSSSSLSSGCLKSSTSTFNVDNVSLHFTFHKVGSQSLSFDPFLLLVQMKALWMRNLQCSEPCSVSSDDSRGGHPVPWKLTSSNHWFLIDHPSKGENS